MGLAVLGAGCEKVPLLSLDAKVFLQANPTFVVSNGGRSVVTAVLTEPAGTFVPDGTEVFFFTDLGSIPARAKTVDGLARVFFVADARSGPASITAYTGGAAPAPGGSPAPSASPGTGGGSGVSSGQGSARITISVGSALPNNVLVTANPSRITSPRHATITANVSDAAGNPIQHVPVIFTITAASPLEETLDSGGSPVTTDSNGQAFDTLRTRALPVAAPKTVTVSATVPNIKDAATVKVIVN